jgi:hypothetical protein
MVSFFLLFSVEYKSMIYRRVDGFSRNLRRFVISLCINNMAVLRMCVKLCSIFLFSDTGNVVVCVVSCPI